MYKDTIGKTATQIINSNDTINTVKDTAAAQIEYSLAKLEAMAGELVDRMENQLSRYMQDKAKVPVNPNKEQECWPPYFASLRSSITSVTSALEQIKTILDRLEL